MACVYNANTKHCLFSMPALWFGILVLSVFFLGYVATTDSNSNATVAPVDKSEHGEGGGEEEDARGCIEHLTIDGGSSLDRPVQLDPASLDLPNETSVTVDVRASCPGYAHLMLRTFAEVVHVVIEVARKNNTVEPQVAIKRCSTYPCLVPFDEDGSGCRSNSTVGDREFEKIRVSWKNTVTVHFEVDGTMTLIDNTTFSSLKIRDPPLVYGMFLAYFAVPNGTDSNDENVTSTFATSEWKIDVLCQDSKEEDDTDYSSMVTRGHLAGSVIAALLFGILFGALCVYFGPRVVTWIRDDLLVRIRKSDKKTDEEAAHDEELDTLVGANISSPDTATKPAAAAKGPAGRRAPLELPGDASPANPSSRRIASANAYTPYGVDSAAAASRKGSRGAAGTDVTTARGDDGGGGGGGGDTPRKGSGASGPAGRITKSPLPALPGDAVKDSGKKDDVSKKNVTASAGAATGGGGEGGGKGQGKEKEAEVAANPLEPEEFYVNAEARVYEGLKHDAPIYENRNTGVYETLRPDQSAGKSPAAPPSKKTKSKRK